MPTPTSYKFVVDGLARTLSGKTLNLLSPNADQIDIEDIATALSRTAMYVGESEHFYSLAQHSFEVARNLEKQQFRLAGLLSCAAAAYIGDISKIRASFPDLANAERCIQEAIHKRFGLPETLPTQMAEEIQRAELKVQATEFRDLLPPERFNWYEASGIYPALGTLSPMSHARARNGFKNFLNMIQTADLLGD